MRIKTERRIRSDGTALGIAPEDATAQPAVVELHINELVLHGFRPGDRHAILDAVQHEFTHLLSGPDATDFARDSMHLGRLDAGSFKVMRGSRSATLGEQVAQAVYKSLISSARQTDAGGKDRRGAGRDE